MGGYLSIEQDLNLPGQGYIAYEVYKILTVTKHGGNLRGEVDLNSSEPSLIWALHNPLKGWTLFNLSEKELILLLKTLSETELRLAKVCDKIENQWKALDRTLHAAVFPEKTPTGLHSESTGYPEMLSGSDTSVTDTGYFIIKPSRVQHPRLHVRHDINVPCVLIGNNKQFHTETVDLSEGGLHFKNSIPPWIAGYFLVVIKSNYQLMCSLVEDQKEKKRVQIVSEESDFHFIQYKNWLDTF